MNVVGKVRYGDQKLRLYGTMYDILFDIENLCTVLRCKKNGTLNARSKALMVTEKGHGMVKFMINEKGLFEFLCAKKSKSCLKFICFITAKLAALRINEIGRLEESIKDRETELEMRDTDIIEESRMKEMLDILEDENRKLIVDISIKNEKIIQLQDKLLELSPREGMRQYSMSMSAAIPIRSVTKKKNNKE